MNKKLPDNHCLHRELIGLETVLKTHKMWLKTALKARRRKDAIHYRDTIERIQERMERVIYCIEILEGRRNPPVRRKTINYGKS